MIEHVANSYETSCTIQISCLEDIEYVAVAELILRLCCKNGGSCGSMSLTRSREVSLEGIGASMQCMKLGILYEEITKDRLWIEIRTEYSSTPPKSLSNHLPRDGRSGSDPRIRRLTRNLIERSLNRISAPILNDDHEDVSSDAFSPIFFLIDR